MTNTYEFNCDKCKVKTISDKKFKIIKEELTYNEKDPGDLFGKKKPIEYYVDFIECPNCEKLILVYCEKKKPSEEVLKISKTVKRRKKS